MKIRSAMPFIISKKFSHLALFPNLSLSLSISHSNARCAKIRILFGCSNRVLQMGGIRLTEAVVLLTVVHLQGAASLDETMQDHLVLGMEALFRLR